MCRILFAVLALIATPVVAQDAIADYFAQHGCAVGPSTRAKALADGYSALDIDALLASDPEGIKQGNWQVLSPKVCQITLPKIDAEITLEDPVVQPFISSIDAYPDPLDRGCFLNGAGLTDALAQQSGWDKDRAFWAYIQLLATGIISGELRFYSDDPLRTPPGFRVTTGACGAVPVIADVQSNHALLVETFPAFMRQQGKQLACSDDSYAGQAMPIIQELTNGENTNAWMFFEYDIIAIGAGWYEGAGARSRGTPRPPVCHYD